MPDAPEGIASLIREAEAALARDPDYARAHMILAWAHLYQVWSGWTDDPAQAIEQGAAAAEKAVAADRNDFWGHAALGSRADASRRSYRLRELLTTARRDPTYP